MFFLTFYKRTCMDICVEIYNGMLEHNPNCPYWT